MNLFYLCVVVCLSLLSGGAKADGDKPKQDAASIVLHASSLFAELVLHRLQAGGKNPPLSNRQLIEPPTDLALGKAFVGDFGELIGNRLERSLKSLFAKDDDPDDGTPGVKFHVFGDDFDYGEQGPITRGLECLIRLFHRILNRILKFSIAKL